MGLGNFFHNLIIYCLSPRASKSLKLAPLFTVVLSCCHFGDNLLFSRNFAASVAGRGWIRQSLVCSGIRVVGVQKQRQAELNTRAYARAAFRLCQLAASLSRSEMTPHFHKGIRNSLDFLSQLIIVWV